MARRKYWLLKFALLLAVALAVVWIRFPAEIGIEKKETDRFTVRKVLDGDTADLAGGDRLRLLAIDCPEEEEPFHDEARRMLERVATGKPARLEYGKNRRDRYGRLLGYLYVDDTIFVNRLLIDSGYANLYLFKDNDLSSTEIAELLEAQKRAIGRKVGIWSVDRGREEYYVSPHNSLRFHRPSCPELKDARADKYTRYNSREEALVEGLSPCRSCHP